MTITEADYRKLATQIVARPRVTDAQRADAIRAQQALSHPGFGLLQARLADRRDEIARTQKAALERLAHARGLTVEEIHRLREDLAHCAGWLNGLDLALGLLPEIVKAGTEDA